MIITLSGITGCGKSYYKNLLIQNTNLENMVIYTTRKKRQGEIKGKDKNFVTKEEFKKLVEKNEMFAYYEFLGEEYGYSKRYLKKEINSVTELHYEWIKDFKQKGKQVYSIYIIPKDVEQAKKELKKRNLSQEAENLRLQEIEEHIKTMQKNEELRKQFDFVFYNDYNEESCERMIQLVKKNILTKKENDS